MLQGLDWLELLWRGVRTLFGFPDQERGDSLERGGDIAAAVIAVVIVAIAIVGVLAIVVSS